MHRDERIEQTGQLTLTDNKEETSIHLLTIIGEIEGHDNLGSSSKTTKYEHILPQLAAIEDSKNISGLLVLLNTMAAMSKRACDCRDDRFFEQADRFPCAGRQSFHWASRSR